jgi:hypothetical protein
VQTVFAISRNESRSAWVQRSDMTLHISLRKTGFQLPQDASCCRNWMMGAAMFPAKWLVIHPTQ